MSGFEPHAARAGAPATGRRFTRRAVLGASLAAALIGPRPAAAEVNDEQYYGMWHGTLTSGSRVMRLRFEIGLGPSVRFVSIDEGGDARLADRVELRGDRIRIEFDGVFASFEGRLAGADRIEGVWHQTLYRLPLVLVRGGPDEPPADLPVRAPLTTAALAALRKRCGAPALGAAWSARGDAAQVLVDGRRSADATVVVTPHDRWHIGSITKSMTATLVALAVEAGEIGWDDDVARHLGRYVPGLPAEVGATTFRELLSHRAGLAANLPDREVAGFAASRVATIEERRRYAALALALPRVGPLRDSYAYSNNGYVIVAAMLEARLDRPWEALLEERLFQPLGITTAGYGAPGTGALDEPVGHTSGGLLARLAGRRVPVRPGGKQLADNLPAMRPAGGVHLSLPDLLRYLDAHRDRPAALLAAAGWETLHTPPFGGMYALGWERRSDGSRWHNGSNTLWYAEVLIDGPVACAAVANDGVLAVTAPAVGEALMAARAAGGVSPEAFESASK